MIKFTKLCLSLQMVLIIQLDSIFFQYTRPEYQSNECHVKETCFLLLGNLLHWITSLSVMVKIWERQEKIDVRRTIVGPEKQYFPYTKLATLQYDYVKP